MLGTPLVPNQDGSLRLNCLIEGKYKIVQVTVEHNWVVFSDLKEVIQSEARHGTLKDVDPHTLELWKPKDPIATEPEKTLAARIGSLEGGLSEFTDKLDPMDSVFDIFSMSPPKHEIHIIVKVPATAFLTVRLPQPPLTSHTGSDPPVISPNISLRKRTVEGLYDAMMEERLIYVRGTPGSGKSTLMDLLHQHILQKDPNAFVCVTQSWPPRNFPYSVPFDSYVWLQDTIPDFRNRRSLAFLLMDEAQETFGDSCLWHFFLKDIIDNPRWYRVVVFCSYGSISTPAEGTPGGRPQFSGEPLE
ncbi:hypothetical protein F5887DRAFT_1283324 [Amanita rubescens]|nr:hypothetical protein F5887DRAFT_1283324 [Amanita rubescens]